MSKSLTETAAVLGLLAGMVAALKVLASFGPLKRPVQWLWRRLVAEPVRGWFRALVHDEVVPVVQASVAAEFKKLAEPNGGKSLADLAEALRRIDARLDTGEVPVVES